MDNNGELQIVVNKLVDTYKQLILSTNHNATGELVNSIVGKVEVNGSIYEISIDVASYWKYLEYGVNGTENNNGSPYSFSGKMLPTAGIENWITVKSIVPTAINGKVPTTKQLAYAIAKSIPKKGLQPHNLLQKAIDANVDEIVDTISKSFNREIEEITTLPDYSK